MEENNNEIMEVEQPTVVDDVEIYDDDQNDSNRLGSLAVGAAIGAGAALGIAFVGKKIKKHIIDPAMEKARTKIMEAKSKNDKSNDGTDNEPIEVEEKTIDSEK